MLFAAILAVFLLAEPLLEQELKITLAYGAGVLGLLQTARCWIRSGDFFSTILSAILTMFLMPFIAVILVLFGAPVSILQQETILASFHITILAVQPMISELGLESGAWFQALGLQFPWTDVYAGALGTVGGAWLGAVPIALDWDRPWQTWPITIIIGAYSGCIAGTLFGFFYGESNSGLKSQQKVKSRSSKVRKLPSKRSK